MTEIKAFFEQIEKIQNDVLSLSGQTPRAKAGTLGKEQIEELTRIVRDNYGTRFPMPIFPNEPYPEEFSQQAMSYFADERNYATLLKPASAFGMRRAKEEDYTWFMTMADVAGRYYKLHPQEQESEENPAEHTLREAVERFVACGAQQMSNTRQVNGYDPKGSRMEELYLGDILYPMESSMDTRLWHNLWDGQWLSIPFSYSIQRPFTLFVDAPDAKDFTTNQESVGVFLRGLFYQMLHAAPAYTCQFYFIDQGNAAASLKELSSLKSVINNSAYILDDGICNHRYQMLKIATTSSEASDLFKELEERMGKVSTLIGGEKNLLTYNAKRMSDGMVQEGQKIVPQCIVVVDNVHDLDNHQMQTLKRLILNSRRCGISVILISGRTKDEGLTEPELSLKNEVSDWLEASGSEREGYEWFTDLSAASLGETSEEELRRMHFRFRPNSRAAADQSYLNEIRESLKPNLDMETALEKRINLEQAWGASDGAAEIKVPIGVNEQGKVTYINIGGSDGAHALLAGSTGCGKSTLLHAIINGVIVNYKPTDVQLWLADYKLNEFQRYAENTPPHVKFVGISRSMEYSLSFIERIHEEMERRQQAFGKITSLKEYRKEHGSDSMPRILIVIDEFHKMSDHVRDDPEHKQMLTNILKEARSVGISLLLSDQTCGIGLRGLSEEGKEQLTLRMSMRSSIDEYNAVMGITNARDVRELKMLSKWEVTLKRSEIFKNEENEEETRYYFEWNKTLYVSDDCCKWIAEKSIQDYGANTDVQVVRSGVRIWPDWEKIRCWEHKKPRRAMEIFVGVPTTLEPYLAVPLFTNFEENLMCIGSDDIRQISMMEQVIQSVLSAGEPCEIDIMADEYEPMFYDCEELLKEMEMRHSEVRLYSGEEAVCRKVAELAALTHKRLREKGEKKKIFVLWIGLAGLVQSLAEAPDEYPEAIRQEVGGIKSRKKSLEKETDDLMQSLEERMDALFGSSEDSFDMGSDEEEQETDDTEEELPIYNIANDVESIVRTGPRQSIVTVVFHPSVSALKRSRCVSVDEFRHRIAFGIGSDDALAYLNSSRAIKDAEGNLIDDSMDVYYDGRGYHQFAPFYGSLEETE